MLLAMQDMERLASIWGFERHQDKMAVAKHLRAMAVRQAGSAK
jgi:hypothetical protein